MDDAHQQLTRIVTPVYPAGDTVDWPAAAAGLGVTGFPADYREFVTRFGAGSLDDSLFVWVPRPGRPTEPLTVGRLPEDTLRAVEMARWRDPAAGSRYVLADTLVWGQSTGGDALCWVTGDPDPGRWPVAVWARQWGGWSVHDCGMAEFLVRLLRADFPACPLSDATLWGEGTARFLNFRDEERLRDEGIDPWTGEPDPFAGMEFD
ncbi:hypothetical protein [Streptomyces sp. NPDC057617]|uniref:hypothetical protein n=1 Tax=Streptomyces sp. NPDC057617 TaxID=3346184 RepID=UPI0036A938EE